MSSVAPDIALLRNAVVKHLLSLPGETYESVGLAVGMTRQSVWRLARTYGLLRGTKPTRRQLNEDEQRIVDLAHKLKIAPPVPLVNAAPKSRRGRAARVAAAGKHAGL